MLLPIALLALLAAPQTPDPTLPPASAHARLTAVGHGVQIYHCGVQGSTFQWLPNGPNATLFDPETKQQVGTHFAGPTWAWSDGSAITGKVLQQQPSPNANSIPWLLLEAHAANDTQGALSGIAYVRRSETQAGAAPTQGCDAERVGISLRIPYQAVYTFYTAN